MNIFEIILEWFSSYLIPILISILAIIIGYILYFIIKKQLLNLAKREKLERNTALNIIKAVKYLIFLVIISLLSCGLRNLNRLLTKHLD